MWDETKRFLPGKLHDNVMCHFCNSSNCITKDCVYQHGDIPFTATDATRLIMYLVTVQEISQEKRCQCQNLPHTSSKWGAMCDHHAR